MHLLLAFSDDVVMSQRWLADVRVFPVTRTILSGLFSRSNNKTAHLLSGGCAGSVLAHLAVCCPVVSGQPRYVRLLEFSGCLVRPLLHR